MNIYLVFLMTLCTVLSWQASRVVVSLFAIELGASQFYIGILIAMYSVFPLLIAVYVGKLIDRFGVRAPLLFGSTGVAVGLLLPFLFPRLPALYASAALIGACHIFSNVAVQSLVGILSNSETRTRNFSNFTITSSIAGTLGPLAAGFSIDHFGHASTYLYLSAVPLVSVLTLICARRLGQQAPRKKAAKEEVMGARTLFTNAPLRRIIITGGCVQTGIDLFQFYMPIYGHGIGLSASAIGTVISFFGAAAFVVRLVMPALVTRWGEDQVYRWSIFLGATVYLLFPLLQNAVLLAAVAFIFGLGVGGSNPLALSLIHSRAPQGRSAEALGLRLTVNNLTHIVVPVLFGTLGSMFGMVPVFIANSLVLAGGGLLVERRGKL